MPHIETHEKNVYVLAVVTMAYNDPTAPNSDATIQNTMNIRLNHHSRLDMVLLKATMYKMVGRAYVMGPKPTAPAASTAVASATDHDDDNSSSVVLAGWVTMCSDNCE